MLAALLAACGSDSSTTTDSSTDDGGTGGGGGTTSSADLTPSINSVSDSSSTFQFVVSFTVTNQGGTAATPQYVRFFGHSASAPARDSSTNSSLILFSDSVAANSSATLSGTFTSSSYRNGGSSYLWVDAFQTNTDSNSSNDTAGPFAWTPTFTYTVTSSNIAVGNRVIVIRADDTSPCGAVSSVTKVGSGTATASGTATVTFSDARTSYWWESVYIDKDSSGTLSNGDLVWGSSSTNVVGVCNPVSTRWTRTQTVNWDSLASSAGGSSTWSGGTQTFAYRAPLPFVGVGIDAPGGSFASVAE